VSELILCRLHAFNRRRSVIFGIYAAELPSGWCSGGALDIFATYRFESRPGNRLDLSFVFLMFIGPCIIVITEE